MKEILLVNSSLSEGGSERVMTILANELYKNGYKVKMILLRKKKETYILNENVTKEQLEYSSQNKIFIAIQRFFKLRKILKKYNGKYIISFMDDINKITLLAGLGLKKKVIISERAYPLKGRSKISKILEDILYPLAYKIVFQTEEVKKFYPNSIVKKATVIANPINEDLPIHDCKECNNEIIAVGRLTKQKNFELLIRAFKNVSKKFTNYKLIICGDGCEKENLENLVKNLDIEDKVDFLGYVNDVNRRMNESKIYVSTSDYEGISNSMLEAIAMGIPTIATDCPVGGARLAIHNYENGILIPVGDEDALTSSIIEIIESEKLQNKFNQNGIKIRNTFSTHQILKEWEKIMKD